MVSKRNESKFAGSLDDDDDHCHNCFVSLMWKDGGINTVHIVHCFVATLSCQ